MVVRQARPAIDQHGTAPQHRPEPLAVTGHENGFQLTEGGGLHLLGTGPGGGLRGREQPDEDHFPSFFDGRGAEVAASSTTRRR